MSLSEIILGVYGLLLLSGAYFGWKAGSKISMIMGIISGTIVLDAVYLTRYNQQLGFGILVGISGALSILFLKRLLKTKKMMPSGMLLLMSIVSFIVSISYFIRK